MKTKYELGRMMLRESTACPNPNQYFNGHVFSPKNQSVSSLRKPFLYYSNRFESFGVLNRSPWVL
jgi:hypothetical protein